MPHAQPSMCTHMHTCTNAHTCTRKQACAHIAARVRSGTCTQLHAPVHAGAHADAHARARRRTRAPTCMHAPAHSRAHACTRAYGPRAGDESAWVRITLAFVCTARYRLWRYGGFRVAHADARKHARAHEHAAHAYTHAPRDSLGGAVVPVVQLQSKPAASPHRVEYAIAARLAARRGRLGLDRGARQILLPLLPQLPPRRHLYCLIRYACLRCC